MIPMKASHLQTHFHSWDKQGTERWTERPRTATNTQAVIADCVDSTSAVRAKPDRKMRRAGRWLLGYRCC